MSKNWGISVIICAMALVGCEGGGGHKARLERLEDGVVALEQEVGDLQVSADESARLSPGASWSIEGARGGCFEVVDTIVRNHRGTDCETYEWELAPASRKCVTAFNEPARYAESAASGQEKCEELCAARECPRGVFSPPEACETVRCFQNYSRCQAGCPHFNSCYLVHSARPWNCQCLEL